MATHIRLACFAFMPQGPLLTPTFTRGRHTGHTAHFSPLQHVAQAFKAISAAPQRAPWREAPQLLRAAICKF